MNRQEHEDAIFKGAMSAEYWMYDARIGRRWELDPIVYPWLSPYATFNNNPIQFSDPNGAEPGEGDVPKNSKGSVIGTKSDPAVMTEVEVIIPKAEAKMPVATTGNGPASGQQLPNAPTQKETTPGNYYNGLWEIAYNPNLRAASNFNTQNQSMPRYLGEPTAAQYMQQAQNLAYSGGFSASYAGFGVTSTGDVSLGYKNPNVTINVLDPSVKGLGAGGVMINSSGFSAGPINATNETTGYTPGPYIVHDQTGKVTGTVQANFIINNVNASVFVGGYKSAVTAVRSFSSTDGSVKTQTIGTTVNKGFTVGGSAGGFSGSLDFNVK
jgi:hypothetical protein